MPATPLRRRPCGRFAVVPENDACDDARVPAPDPRFTMANERTFLAWNRTALAFIAVGLAVEQFVDASRALRLVVSVPLILLGGVVGVGGYLRWRQSEDAMARGEDVDPS